MTFTDAIFTALFSVIFVKSLLTEDNWSVNGEIFGQTKNVSPCSVDRRMTDRLYQQIARQIEAQLSKGLWKIGDRLPAERELAQRFSVSRQTIREAVIALEVDGVLEVVPGSGVYVRSIHAKLELTVNAQMSAFEILEARALFEGESAALAARNTDDDQILELEELLEQMRETLKQDVELSENVDRKFHTAIAKATNNSAVQSVVESLWSAQAQSKQAARLFERARTSGIEPRMEEHEAILIAIKDHDPVEARRAMRAHLSGVIDAILRATEVEALEQIRAKSAATKQRYALEEDE